MKYLFPTIKVLAILAIGIIAAACTQSTPVSDYFITNPFDEKVDIGRFALHIRCTGEHTPTVIIETGFGEPGVGETSSWKNVIAEIEQKTRICAYDRAGLGSSDVAPGANRSSRDMAKDLHALLVNAGIPGPYILVAHSLGGFTARVFAHDYKNEVVGMVLVDSSHPDQWSAINKILPLQTPDEPESLKQIRIIPPASLPEKMDIPTSINQVRAVKTLGDLPLVVLSHSANMVIDPNLSPDLSGKIEQLWEKLQNDLAALSSNSTHLIAVNAGHYIQVDEPKLVIDAILKLIDESQR